MKPKWRRCTLTTNTRLLLFTVCLLCLSFLLNSLVLLQQQQQQQQQQRVHVNDVQDLFVARRPNPLHRTSHVQVNSRKDTANNRTDHLLQFAIVGFGKCGTTSLLRWLQTHPEIAALPVENFDLMRHQPEQLIAKLQTLPADKIKGYKSPVDITLPHVLNYFAEYFPHAKLIVGVRHPVHWFESLYNFRLRNLPPASTIMPPPDLLIGSCVASARNTCTYKGEFALFLRQLGKTNHSLTEFERRMYRGANWNPPNTTSFISNSIFLYEMRELHDHPEWVAEKLTEFLGLSTPLSSVIPYHNQQQQRSSSSFMTTTTATTNQSNVMNICEHRRVRFELMRIARASSVWIRHYFLNAPSHIIVTMPQLDSYIKDWMIDPCENQRDETQSAGRYILQAFREEQERSKQHRMQEEKA